MFEAMRDQRHRAFAEETSRAARARGRGLSGRRPTSSAPCSPATSRRRRSGPRWTASSWPSPSPTSAPKADGARTARPMPRSGAVHARPDVRRPGHLALWTSRSDSASPTSRSARRWARRRSTASSSRGWRRRRDRPRSRTIATPSSTRSSSRSCSSSTSTGPPCAWSRSSAARSPRHPYRRPARRRRGGGAHARRPRASVAAAEGRRLIWVAGVDMAHVGRRYGDGSTPGPTKGPGRGRRPRTAHAARCLAAGDAPGFWSRLQQGGDPLRWCGASPLYTLLAVRPPRPAARSCTTSSGTSTPSSVVSCGALAFTALTPPLARLLRSLR